MSGDHELLRAYAGRHSEQAFTELVERHVGLVYSTALRLVREPHLAKDIAQKVFVQLARKPWAIRNGQALAGWLYRTTRFTAAALLRAERRRRERENAAVQLNTLQPDGPSIWQALAPHLDRAMDTLERAEQDAVALRFFEGRSLREVGRVLGISDDAAQKRVSRALEKLRLHFASRGIAASTNLVGTALATHAVAAAPADLAAGVAAASLAGTAGAGTSALTTILNAILMTKTKTALVAALAIAAVTTPMVLQHRAKVRFQREVEALRWEKAALLAQQPGEDPARTKPAVEQALSAAAGIARDANRSVEEVVAETAVSLANARGEGNWTVMGKWSDFLGEIPRDQIDRALLATLKLSPGDVRSAMTMVLFHNWAEANPRAALAFATVNFHGKELSTSVNEALLNWAKQEPEAAFGAWREQSSDPAKRMAWGGNQEPLVKSLFEGMAQQDLQKAAGFLESVEREQVGSALAGLGSAAARTAEGRTLFLQLLERVTDPAMKQRANQAFMWEWANRNDLHSAMAWVESLPVEARGAYAQEVGSVYVRRNPKAGADWWLAQTSNDRERATALMTITDEWAPKDLSAAGEWLNRQGSGPEVDGARSSYARQVLRYDPETAMKWVQSIHQPSLRTNCSAGLWQEWRKFDAAAAEQFLSRSGWPAKLVAQAKGERDAK